MGSGRGWAATNPPTIPGPSIARQVTWLAVPVLIEQALLYLVGLSDTLLTGRYLSEDHLAAVTVASYLLWFLGSLLTVVSVGATALVARLIGSNQPEAARRIGQQAMLMAWVVGGLTTVAGDESRPVGVPRPEPARRGGSVRGAVPADRAGGGAAGGLHDGGGRLPARGRRHADRDVGDDPGQRDQCRLELGAGRGLRPAAGDGTPRDRGGDGPRRGRRRARRPGPPDARAVRACGSTGRGWSRSGRTSGACSGSASPRRARA